MTISIVKTNFTAGELSYNMLGRGDVKAYDNGALFLRNVYVSPTGGVTRRAGLRYVASLGGKSRLISFSFNTEQAYLIVLADETTFIYKDESLVATLATPWTEEDLHEIRWTQSADTLLIAHPSYPLKKITRYSHTSWTVTDWTFYESAGYTYQPYHKFASANVTVSLSGISGSISVVASSAVFTANHVGKRLRIAGGEVLVTAFVSDTTLTATVTAGAWASPPVATPDWQEPAFSDIRGYPVCVTFHQGRLVIGGSRDLPNRLWMSKSGDLPNFDLGTGLDDEAIDFGLLSDEVNAIKALVSGRHLQVFTSGAEWMVSGDPLTPSSIQLKRQTRIGSCNHCYVPPRNVDGATIFCSNGGKGVREFLFSDLEQAYQAADLALLSSHLINFPIDEEYDSFSRLLYIVMLDGSMGVLTNYRSENVSAWSKYETDGSFVSVCLNDGKVFTVTERDEEYYLEVFDDTLFTDLTLSGEETTAKKVWSGLSIMEDKQVNIIADKLIVQPQTVQDGKITLDFAANKVAVGLPFTHKILPLPYTSLSATRRAVKSVRMVRGIFKVLNTASLKIDVGLGFISAIPLIFDKDKFGNEMKIYTKDVILQGIGWIRDAVSKPLWRIESDSPAPFSLIAVTTEMKVSE